MALITIDVGGSSIKYSLFSEGKLGEVKSKQTPDNLEDYYSCLKDIVREMRQESKNITGVAMSSPGAVNQATGY
ncbi:MAG: ROK family protein, partial [Lactococcus sp.]